MSVHFTVKRGFSQKEQCYKYGIMKDGKLYEKMTLFGKRNADLIADLMNMMEEFILDKDTGTMQVMQIRRIDEERYKNGKVEHRNH